MDEDNKLIRVGWRGTDKKILAPSTTVNPPDGWLEAEDFRTKYALSDALKGRKSQSKDDLSTWIKLIEKWKDYK